MTHLLIIGGSDAGISAALRAREIAFELEITIVLSDSFPNFSICGLPFFLSGEVLDWRNLAHRTAEEITAQGIHLQMAAQAWVKAQWQSCQKAGTRVEDLIGSNLQRDGR